MKPKTMIELFRQFPSTRRLPWLALGDYPTPVQSLAALGEAVGVPDLWIKRDDLSGELYGGNKIRKLEFLLGAAKARGCRRVWTTGAIGSHHCLATALYARRHDLEPYLLHYPQPVTEHVLENLRALSTTYPHIEYVSSEKLPLTYAQRMLRDRLHLDPETYVIAAGGSSPTGALGYVNAVLELARQIEEGDCPEPDMIVAAAGTGGTLAGLALGTRLAGLRSHVVGVCVTSPLLINKPLMLRMAHRAAALLEEDTGLSVPRLRPVDFTILHDHLGPGYGLPTLTARRARDVAERHADLELELTYTAKAFGAIVRDRDRLALADRRVMYWHTLSSVDLSPLVERADIEGGLPDSYRAYFEQGAEI